ncbi:MAG: 4Fe-4S binding protein [Defluviitaleaceae bacterium]|nr:4Fe-4S binding protein [Defluviitaleaceae bacterium]
MAYTITKNCITCGACLPECPVSAISEGEPFNIDPDMCIDCNACAVVCPTDAIES